VRRSSRDDEHREDDLGAFRLGHEGGSKTSAAPMAKQSCRRSDQGQDQECRPRKVVGQEGPRRHQRPGASRDLVAKGLMAAGFGTGRHIATTDSTRGRCACSGNVLSLWGGR